MVTNRKSLGHTSCGTARICSVQFAIQERIEVKDAVRYKDGPYDRYVLVIHTDEFFLDSATVRQFLKGATFRARLINDVIVGLSYEPASGACPVFRLELIR